MTAPLGEVAALSAQAALTAVLLPPILLVLVCAVGGGLAWCGSRLAGLAATLSALVLLLLATPFVSGLLMASLEEEVLATLAAPSTVTPAAIVILGAEASRGRGGVEVGPMTLARLRAGAALHRRTGLPMLVTGGVLAPGDPPIATLMARSLEEDFRVPAHWVEPRAGDTWDNAVLSTAMLRADSITAVYVVSHGWHLPRALGAFRRAGLAAVPAPLGLVRVPGLGPADWLPRADRLGESWFALREWAGRLVYAIRH